MGGFAKIQEVQAYENTSDFPATGAIGIVYQDTTNDALYIWDEETSQYVNPTATTFSLKLQSQQISSGSIPYIGAFVELQPETGLTDTLTNITGGTEGDIIIIRRKGSGDTIFVDSTVGNIDLANGLPIEISSDNDFLTLIYVDNSWQESSRSIDADFATSAGTNGYAFVHSRILLQWGLSASGGNPVNVTFPIEYPSAARSVNANPANTAAIVSANIGSLTTTGFSITFSSGSYATYWQSIGIA
jgi:hypothetical protein